MNHAGALLLLWSSVLGHRSLTNAALAVTVTTATVVRIHNEALGFVLGVAKYDNYRRFEVGARIVP